MRRRGIQIALAGACGGLAAAAIALAAWAYSLGPLPLGRDLDYSRIVVARDGRLLRAFATPDGRWRLPATVADVDPLFLRLLLAYEDKRFYHHAGVDLLALGRAALQLATNGHIVSGGSTITMQVARLLEPREHRTFLAKLRQIVRAVELEHRLSKADILSLYLTLAPYGGNLEGVRAASLAYFGKEPRHLSLAEAALLVALPQSPALRRPDRHPHAAFEARNRVLDRAAAAGVVTREEARRAKAEPVPATRKQLPMIAPHAADEVVAADPLTPMHRLTLDADLQSRLEALARVRAEALGPEVSVAILAVDNATGEVRAHVGSAGFFDRRRAGEVDMTVALRSPGSTLKPFIYGLGFEDGFLHPETLIDDRPMRYGHYAPENFDRLFHGAVSVRRALQWSLNLPAVEVLDRVGAERLMARLRQAGAAPALPRGETPGLAMGLGGVGLTLRDLTLLYEGLARQGSVLPLVEKAAQERHGPRRLLDAVAAWYVDDILLGAPPPDHAPAGRLAFKTGTSYGNRDAWAVGFDGRMTIGVWIGRPDGAPVPGMTGRSAAAPILFDAFARAGRDPAALAAAPAGAVRAGNAQLPPPLRHFRPDGGLADAGDRPRIMFPPDGAQIELSDDGEPIAVKVAGGHGLMTVMVNGVPLPAERGGHTLFFHPDGPGFARLTVIDARGRADSVTVRFAGAARRAPAAE